MSQLRLTSRPGSDASSRTASTAVYLLAEHLDAVLAAGEDLCVVGYDVPKRAERVTAVEIAERIAAEHAFVGRVRELEMALIARILQARLRSAEVVREDRRFRPIIGLFSGGTRPLVDAVADLGPDAQSDAHFNASNDTLGYFRSRALIGAESASLELISRIDIGEAFRVAGRIELGPLLDLAATFLTTLELHYDLFEAADEAAELRASAA